MFGQNVALTALVAPRAVQVFQGTIVNLKQTKMSCCRCCCCSFVFCFVVNCGIGSQEFHGGFSVRLSRGLQCAVIFLIGSKDSRGAAFVLFREGSGGWVISCIEREDSCWRAIQEMPAILLESLCRSRKMPKSRPGAVEETSSGVISGLLRSKRSQELFTSEQQWFIIGMEKVFLHSSAVAI